MENKFNQELFAQRLSQVMLENNLSSRQLSEQLNLSHTTITRYMNGEVKPKTITVLKIAEITNVNFEWLIGISDKKFPTQIYTSSIKIPVISRISNNTFSSGNLEIIDYENVPLEIAEQGDMYVLQLKNSDGLSSRFFNNCRIIFHKQNDLSNGDYAIIIINNKISIRKIQKFKGGLNLIPFNIEDDILTYTTEELKAKSVYIIGKIIEIRANFLQK